ncbi:MAG: hypothetical protein ABSF95_01560 [Verrucomicrobiota bacterium]|jgi:hypothetical protein
MSSDYEKQLEAEIDAVLKTLPERAAPRTLLPRVMAAIASRAPLPWFRQGWQMWPAGLRVASLAILLALFGGLCLAGWELPKADAYASATREVGRWLSGVGALWNVVNVLSSTMLAVVKQLPTGFIAACLASLALGYALCMGLGAAWLRFAFARR